MFSVTMLKRLFAVNVSSRLVVCPGLYLTDGFVLFTRLSLFAEMTTKKFTEELAKELKCFANVIEKIRFDKVLPKDNKFPDLFTKTNVILQPEKGAPCRLFVYADSTVGTFINEKYVQLLKINQIYGDNTRPLALLGSAGRVSECSWMVMPCKKINIFPKALRYFNK
jgi:hypothetical protein